MNRKEIIEKVEKMAKAKDIDGIMAIIDNNLSETQQRDLALMLEGALFVLKKQEQEKRKNERRKI